MTNKTFTYSSYLKIDELIALQKPCSNPQEHDEMLFIVIHQVYELWFKLLLHEFDKVRNDLSAGELYDAIATIKRVRTVMKTLVSQLDILETMTPMSFTSFRNRLESASGFQSYQFRELEFLLGYKRKSMMSHYEAHPEARARLEKRLCEPSVIDAFYDFLEHHRVTIPTELRTRPKDEPNIPHAHIQDALVHLYKHRRDLAILLEMLTDFDEGLQEWRYRHVKMVERTIGAKPGTGGSSGTEFLKSTLFKPVFEDLWIIRHRL